ncbi:MAG TPA: YihY/virulence factor BrkB family protein [Tepidisphaeraceae bacterium]|jgi:membrane protein
MPAQSPLTLARQTWSDFSDDNASRLAAALAYYTIFALAPLLVIAVVVMSFVMRSNGGAKEKVVHYFTSTAQGIDPNTIRTMIDKASSHGSGIMATMIAAVITLAGAFGFFSNLQGALNTVWEVKPRPDVGFFTSLKKRFVSFLIVGGMMLVMLASLAVTTWLTGFAASIFSGTFGKIFAFVLDVVGSLVVYTGIFAVIFKFVPDVKITWKQVAVGAVLTAVLFLIGKYLLSIYLTKGSSTSVFGAAGSLAALLIWVYYSGHIVLFGAEFTQVYARSQGEEIEPDEIAMPLSTNDRARLGKTKPRQGLPHEEFVADNRHAPDLPAARLPKRLPAFASARSSRTSSVVAAGGLALGFAMGAAGWLKNRKDPVRDAKLQFTKLRLDQLERRLSNINHFERRVHEYQVDKRLSDTHHHIHNAIRELHKNMYRRPKSDQKRSWKEMLVSALH